MSGPAPTLVSPPTAADPVRAWLLALGYRLAFRVDGFVECLLVHGSERHLGRGVDEASAFDDALRLAVPSHAARSAMEHAVGTAQPPARSALGRPGDSLQSSTLRDRQSPSAVTIQTAVVIAPPPTPRTEPTYKPSSRHASDTMLDLPAIRLEVPQARVKETQAYIGVPIEASRAPPAVSSDGEHDENDHWSKNLPAIPSLDPDAAFAEVTDLIALVEERRPQLAQSAPERQRLQLLVWICHARSLQEGSHRHPRVVNAVAEIARILGTLSKLWWPGSVGALQLDATPADVGRELGATPRDRAAMTWTIAAEHAEQRLRDVEARDEQAGLDEDGWSDIARLDPPPLGALERLMELRKQVEKLCGNVEDKPLPGLPDDQRRLTAEMRDTALRWCRLIRWLRGQTTEFSLWGMIIGRLRWLAATTRDEALSAILDPRSSPARSWATELGEDPEAKRNQARRKEVIKKRPQAGDSPESVKAWVFDALGTLEAERVARFLVDAHRDQILAVVPDSLEERRLRRQMKRLHLHLKYPDGVPPEALAGEARATEEAMPAITEAEELDGDGLTRDRELLARIVPHTQNRRALFVSNREDPDLRQRLSTAFAFSELEWSDGTPRRLQDLADRVAGGRYDLVLGATGFQSHNMDAVFARACRKAKVPYVRVHRGRQLACILGLAREFGIATDGVSGMAF